MCTSLTNKVYHRSTPQPPPGVPQGVHTAYSSAPPGCHTKQNKARLGWSMPTLPLV